MYRGEIGVAREIAGLVWKEVSLGVNRVFFSCRAYQAVSRSVMSVLGKGMEGGSIR